MATLVLSGKVVMQQGDRKIRADHLELNPQDRSAKLEGGVEYTDPNLVVRGNSGEYSPTLGANFQGTQFELPNAAPAAPPPTCESTTRAR